MLVTIDEMNSVVDAYKLDSMTDNTPEITATSLRAAEARVLSYLGGRYDLDALHKLSTDSYLLADLKEMIKDIALYLIMRRHNVDIAYSRVVDTYKLHSEYLSRVASGGRSPLGERELKRLLGADAQTAPRSLPARGAGLKPLLRTRRQRLLRQCDGGETTKIVQRTDLYY